jgi:hypothetical protein
VQQSVGKCITRRNWGGGEGEWGGEGEKDGRTQRKKKSSPKSAEEDRNTNERSQLKDAVVDKESSGIDEWRKDMDE